MGEEAVLIEALPVREGQLVSWKLEDASKTRRHGVWLATDGLMSLVGTEADQFVVWIDTAPPKFDVRIIRTDGLLRFYNVWASDRDPGHRSQSDYSAMLRRNRDDGWIEYSCSDFGAPASFVDLIFSVKLS
jgi:hypothetical protein